MNDLNEDDPDLGGGSPLSDSEVLANGLLKCDLCGEAANGMWRGKTGIVAVCRHCATSYLPALIAYAVTPCHHQVRDKNFDFGGHMAACWREGEAAFWRGAATKGVMILQDAPDPYDDDDDDEHEDEW